MEYYIFGSTVLCVLILSILQPVKGWFKSMRQSKMMALIIITCFTLPHLGGERTVEDAMSNTPSGVRIVRLIVVILLFLISANILIKKPAIFRMAGGAAIFMLGYALFALLSSVWSIDTLITGWKATEVMTLVLAGICFAGTLKEREDIEHLINMLSFIILFHVVSVLLGLILAPSLAIADTFTGSFIVRGVMPSINPNSVTQIAALMFVFAFIQLIRRDHIKSSKATWIILAISCAVMLFGHSRTSMFACVLAIGSVLFFGRYRALAVTLLIAGGAGVLFSQDVVTAFILRGQSDEDFASMTGRVDMWGSTMDYFQESMWVGHGFYAALRAGLGTSSVDNTYLEVLLGVGIIGLAIFIMPLLITARNMFFMFPKKSDDPHVTTLWLQLLGLFILLFVRSITGPTFAVMHTNLPMFMILIISVHALKKYRYRNVHHQKMSDVEQIDSTRLGTRILRRKTRFK